MTKDRNDFDWHSYRIGKCFLQKYSRKNRHGRINNQQTNNIGCLLPAMP